MKNEIVRVGKYKGYTYVVKKYFHSKEEISATEELFNKGLLNAEWFCGYVLIPENHTLYEKDYNYIHENFDIDVHGGLTFSDRMNFSDFFECWNNKYFIGFDCNHYKDNPKIQDDKYTDDECKRLIDQLVKINKRNNRLLRLLKGLIKIFMRED